MVCCSFLKTLCFGAAQRVFSSVQQNKTLSHRLQSDRMRMVAQCVVRGSKRGIRSTCNCLRPFYKRSHRALPIECEIITCRLRPSITLYRTTISPLIETPLSGSLVAALASSSLFHFPFPLCSREHAHRPVIDFRAIKPDV